MVLQAKPIKEQRKEIRYRYDVESLKELADEQPDAILLYDRNGNECLICDHASDFDNGFDTPLDFIKHRLIQDGNDLNELAKELGYDGKPHFTKFDFVADLLDSDRDNLEQTVMENYNGERLGDWLYE